MTASRVSDQLAARLARLKARAQLLRQTPLKALAGEGDQLAADLGDWCEDALAALAAAEGNLDDALNVGEELARAAAHG